MNTSIVIATANRPDILQSCLESLVQTGVPSGIQVVIVDSGDQSPCVPGRMQEVWPNLLYIRFDHKNAAAQRNAGIQRASGDVICFMDDDVIVQSGWWPKIIRGLEDSTVGAVAGAVWTSASPVLTARRGLYVNLFGFVIHGNDRGAGHPENVDWANSVNMACRKTVLLQVGGFEESFGIYDEDPDLSLRIRKSGWRIVFEPEAAVFHWSSRVRRPPPTKLQQFKLGRNRGMLIARNYGVSSRLLLLMICAPLMRCGTAMKTIAAAIWRSTGHAVAYSAGILWGVFKGLRNKPKSDV